jgi:P-type Ca2+ transporter type 2C
MATIYVPALNSIFKTMSLSPAELAATFAIATVVFVAVEIEKSTQRRG